ncbi:hypothetical protein GCM10010464_14830 [Pseudonocardia yunnanensis]|uniref:Uncharacterized protein n=1 Tax=Pseudonocardia yunnanensis TaxID=58107 RepID=A0ABW4EVL2_9PSEU
MEHETSPETTHDLLLSLAGRVDDDLLAWARELVAVGEDAHAVEILTASLVAAGAVLPQPVRSALVAAARSARTDLDPDATLPPARPEESSEHRFEPGPSDDVVAAALLAVPARQLQGCRVLVARRLTPAGSAPGPLPHPVVLVEAQPGARATDVLAYQLAVILDRAGVPASVEVLIAGVPLPAYHAAALRRARPIRWDDENERAAELPGWLSERPAPTPGAPVSPEARQARHPLAPPQADVAGLLGTPPRAGVSDPRPAAPADPRQSAPAGPLPHRRPAAAAESGSSEAGTDSLPAVQPRGADDPAARAGAVEPAARPAPGDGAAWLGGADTRTRPAAKPKTPPAPGEGAAWLGGASTRARSVTGEIAAWLGGADTAARPAPRNPTARPRTDGAAGRAGVGDTGARREAGDPAGRPAPGDNPARPADGDTAARLRAVDPGARPADLPRRDGTRGGPSWLEAREPAGRPVAGDPAARRGTDHMTGTGDTGAWPGTRGHTGAPGNGSSPAANGTGDTAARLDARGDQAAQPAAGEPPTGTADTAPRMGAHDPTTRPGKGDPAGGDRDAAPRPDARGRMAGAGDTAARLEALLERSIAEGRPGPRKQTPPPGADERTGPGDTAARPATRDHTAQPPAGDRAISTGDVETRPGAGDQPAQPEVDDRAGDSADTAARPAAADGTGDDATPPPAPGDQTTHDHAPGGSDTAAWLGTRSDTEQPGADDRAGGAGDGAARLGERPTDAGDTAARLGAEDAGAHPEPGGTGARQPAEQNPLFSDPQEEDLPPSDSLPIRGDRPPRPTPAPQPPRPTVTPINRPPAPAPGPLPRRGESVPPAGTQGPVNGQAGGPPAEEHRTELPQRVADAAEPPRPSPQDPRDDDIFRSLGQTPAFDALNDPLSGPLREPLLEPLLDPTIGEDHPRGAAGKTPTPGDDDREPARGDDEWSSEWLSGSWAMAPSALADKPPRRPDAPEPTSEDVPERRVGPPRPGQAAARYDDELPSREPRPAPRRPARHRYADEQIGEGTGIAEPPAEPSEPEPAPRPEPSVQAAPAPTPLPDAASAELGLRPESLARLSDSDRDLLARLQAELQGGTRPRVIRRAGIANGSAPGGSNGNGSGGNGNPRRDPPDLAG